jgi:DNA invertase Pin-like site-specific DNA recombinase
MTKTTDPKGKALLYVRVSTGRQADEGVSLVHQENQLKAQASLLGFTDCEIVREEGKSGKNLTSRPALTGALDQLDRGEASTLIVFKLDRLSRSIKDVVGICEQARKNNWRLVIMDLNVDTDTDSGEFVLNVMASFAQMERRRIGQRQADVHASRRQTGQVWGVTCGPRTPEAVRTRVLALRANGMTVRAIAQELEAEGIPTARGGNWQASTVAKILKAKAAQPAA